MRMTEKDFLLAVTGDKSIHITSERAVYALELAKRQGAKFDPEPVELPRLISRWEAGHQGYSILVGFYQQPNLSEVQEIIRRCELIPRLRKMITDRFLRSQDGSMTDITPIHLGPLHASDLLDMLDGREIDSDPVRR